MEEIECITVCRSCESIFSGSHLLEDCPKCGEPFSKALGTPAIIQSIVALDAINEMKKVYEFEETLEALEDAGWVYEPNKGGFQALRRESEEEDV